MPKRYQVKVATLEKQNTKEMKERKENGIDQPCPSCIVWCYDKFPIPYIDYKQSKKNAKIMHHIACEMSCEK